MNLDKVAAVFAENFASRGELGASVSIWQDGHEVLNLADGFRDRQKTEPWTAETTVLVWSATKGIAAACALHALAANGRELDEPVAELWPEFGAAGKAEITSEDVLSHRAGLAALSREVSVWDYLGVIAAIEEQSPLWPRGSGHGYHPRTFGFFLDEIVRRAAGMPLGDYWRRTFADPLGLDFWIGVPSEISAEVAPVFAPRVVPPEDKFLRAFADPDSLTSRAFASPKGLHNASAMNTPEARAASFPAFGGIGTARALGKFYAALANGDHTRMSTPLATGFDKVLCAETAFSAGFMMDPLDASGNKVRSIFGPAKRAFGHPGAGGSVAFADPENNVAFAYVMNQMEPGVFANARATAMIDALYS